MPEFSGNTVLRLQPGAEMTVDQVFHGNTVINFRPAAEMTYVPPPPKNGRWRSALSFFAKEVVRSAIRFGVKEALERLRDLLFVARARRTRLTARAAQ